MDGSSSFGSPAAKASVYCTKCRKPTELECQDYCLSFFIVAYVVAAFLITGNGIRFCNATNYPIFNVLNYGALGDGTHDDNQAFSKAWADLCGASGNNPTLFVPGDKTFLLKPISFNGPCKSSMVHFQIDGKLVAPNSVGGWGKLCESSCSAAWLSFERVDNLALWINACNGLRLRGLTHKDSPKAHIRLTNCNDSIVSNLHIVAPEDSPNTDGIDIASITQLQILDSFIGTGDDCIAIGSPSSWINISGVTCGPGHGIRCGGSGYARKITFEDITLIDAANPININQFYCININDDSKSCASQPTAVAVSDVTYNGFQGTSSSVAVMTFNCSQVTPCTNIVLQKIDITSSAPRDQPQSLCENVQGTQNSVTPAVPCLH
ncbi:hypothetical protein Cgig2_013417 [Carnegiea gigantea]|uniref:Polygalacturonase n=1 Tax=Carnegiea gigantea TaxID=171969 RepID=A0A9Q1GJA6_9CARY|nr:hypothetical protein Cgig2_013417 [Carnegiea gigantea]